MHFSPLNGGYSAGVKLHPEVLTWGTVLDANVMLTVYQHFRLGIRYSNDILFEQIWKSSQISKFCVWNKLEKMLISLNAFYMCTSSVGNY